MHLRVKNWEPQNVKRNTVIQIVIAALTVLFLCILWTRADLHTHHWVKQQAFQPNKESITGETFAKEDKKLQTVYFTNDHIYQIKVYMDATIYDNKDFVYFRLYDGNFSCIYSEDFGCNLIARDGFVKATPDLDVTPGQAYYYEIIVPEKATFWWMYTVETILPTASTVALGLSENGPLYVDGIYRDDIALVADFDYGKAYSFWQWAGITLLILAFSCLLYFTCLWIAEKMELYQSTIGKYGRLAVSVLTAGVVLVLLYFCLFQNLFGANTADKVVYGIGNLVGLIWILAAIWIPRERKQHTGKNDMSRIWRNAIQIICFGCLFYAMSQYVNADIEYLHTNNTRWILIFMGIALLAGKPEKMLLHKLNGIWLAVASIGGVLYCLQAQDGQPLYLAKLTIAVVMIWGMVVIQLFRGFTKEIWIRLNKPYFFCWVAFILCTYVFRYEKTWVFTASLPFLAILLYNFSAEEKKCLLQNLAQGILFSFWMITFYALCHRPYHYWIYYRYNGIFHTVACTGLYLSVVIGAAIALVLGKWKNRKRITGVALYELFTLVVAVNYVFFTMARTALLAVAVDMVLVMLLSVYGYKKSFLRMCQEGIILVLCMVLSFPFVYTVQRMVPAMVNKPEYHRIEDHDREFAIHEGEAWDSDKYMTIERFFEMFTGRVSVSRESAVVDENMDLLASLVTDHIQVCMQAEETSEGTSEETSDASFEKTDISNGRLDIFKLYLSKVSWKGNEGASLEDEAGELIAHAHNSYIMVAYNFGLVGGILFLLLCGWTFLLSIKFFIQKGKKTGVYLVPFSLIIIFGFTSLTEWCFHPCFPGGYVFLFMIPLLMEKGYAKNRKH